MDYGEAAEFWLKKEAGEAALERGELLKEAEKFILAHNTCALAAGCGDFVRCTPIEYTYIDGRFFMLSEGGLKFKALERNKNVCLAIYDAYTGFGKIGGMQVSGTAEMIEPWSGEYTALLKYKNIPETALRALGYPMNLIKVTPTRIDFLCSELKERGVSTRQHIEFR